MDLLTKFINMIYFKKFLIFKIVCMQSLLILFGVVSLLLGCFLIFIGQKEKRKSNKCFYYLFGFMFFLLFSVSMLKDSGIEIRKFVIYVLF